MLFQPYEKFGDVQEGVIIKTKTESLATEHMNL